MNRILISVLLTFSVFVHANDYDEALKAEAKGESDNFKYYLDRYFKYNINDANQDSIVEKLLYSSTLFESVNETLDFLLNYVKFLENKTSRLRIYSKIAEFYELTGQILKAGQFYEKAAYVSSENINYEAYLDSIDMLIELGYIDSAINKLYKIPDYIVAVDKNRVNSTICRAYLLKNDRDNAIKYINNIDRTYYLYDYLNSSIYGSIINEESYINKLKSPTDYINRTSQLTEIPTLDRDIIKKSEYFVGEFKNENDAAGIINILEQMNIEWFLGKTTENSFRLYLFTDDYYEDNVKLKKIGIKIEE